MAFLIGGANTSAVTAYDIDNSCRFNDDDDAYLTVTGSSTTSSGKTSTLSIWVKRSKLGAEQYIFHARSADSQGNFARLEFTGDDTLRLRGYSTTYLETDAEYRDPSAWYHIVLALDTDTSGDGNSCRLYVNGSEVTSFSTDTNPSTDDDLVLGSDRAHYVGASFYGGGAGSEFDGYISELHFIDGQQLTPSSFGESDEDSGIWKPKQYSGSYGGNGFKLEFKNSAVGSGTSSTIGADTSGETNHLTSSGIAVTDQSTDTPTNNFATLNPLTQSEPANLQTFAEGNLKITMLNFDTESVMATMGVTSGKWYWEIKGGWKTSNWGFGIEKGSSSNIGFNVGYTATSYSFSQDGWKQNNSSASQIDSGLSDGDIIGYALDLDNGHFNFSQNGVWYNGSASESTTFDTGNHDFTSLDFGSEFVMPTISAFGDTTITTEINFGNPSYANSSSVADANGYGAFEYAPPSGYYALCTKNLAEFG